MLLFAKADPKSPILETTSSSLPKPEKDFTGGNKKGKGKNRGGWDVDYAAPVRGPLLNGFDHYWGIAASLDMTPYVYIHNDKSTAVPTATWASA